jgi:hypothetical protein
VDIGIKEMLLVNTPNGIQPFFVHGGLEQPIPLSLESEGTKQFVCIYPHLWHALHLGGIAVIDEMDSTIHPMPCSQKSCIGFTISELNPHKAQLWMSGHSASLLEELKKEEIFFTEKDQQGRTKIYGLKDIEGCTARRITFTRSIWEACTALYRGLDEQAADSAAYPHLSGLRRARANSRMESGLNEIADAAGLQFVPR